jgi:hypothetical protein
MNPDGLAARLPQLSGEGLVLRALADADADGIYRLFSDSDVVRFMSMRQLSNEAEAREFIADIDRQFETGRLYQWGIDAPPAVPPAWRGTGRHRVWVA